MATPAIPDMAVVFALVAAAIVLFVTERLPPDTTAVAVIVALVVLEPFTHVPATDAISGFSNPATLTVVAMYILSGGIEGTGVIRRLGDELARFIGHDAGRLFGVTVGVTGPLAGIVNNTPVVAVLLPTVVDLADRVHVSPSKLLIPLSYASMLGGTLTLVGTSTNLIASDLSAQLVGRRFTMFEFTGLGVVVLLVGTAYLLTVGQRLLPERVRAVDLTAEFAVAPYLWRLHVRRSSPAVGRTVEAVVAGGDRDLAGDPEVEHDLEILQVVRGDRSFVAPGTDQDVQAGDRLTVRAPEAAVRAFADRLDLRLLPPATVTEAELDRPEGPGLLLETVVRPESSLVGRTIADAAFRERYRATVLALRRGGEVVHEGLADIALAEGDGLLLHATGASIDALRDRDELVTVETSGEPPAPTEASLASKAPLAVGILLAVIAVAALGLLPIVIAALAGVVAMVAGGVVSPREAYDAVHWDVIFLLAGVLPLGLALQRSGGAEFVGGLLVGAASLLPPLGVLALVYLVAALLANVVTPVASVVLMLPVAVDVATRLDANAFAFVLATTFAVTSAFMTPIGYQTNLMVYSPGGYRFLDYVRVGAPLQVLHAVTVTLGIAVIWGVT